MSRFEDFEKLERRVIREALTGAQSEFYDPGHTQEDRDTLEALIREIEGDGLPFTFGEEPDHPVLHINGPAPVAPQRIDVAFTYGEKKAQEPPRDARQGGPERPGVHTRTPGRQSAPAGPQGPPQSPKEKPASCLSGAPIAETFTCSAPGSLSQHTDVMSAADGPR